MKSILLIILMAFAVLPKPTGPDRLGLHKSSTNAFEESDIYVSTKLTGGYFGCGDTTTGHIQIMYSVNLGGGTWGPALPVD